MSFVFFVKSVCAKTVPASTQTNKATGTLSNTQQSTADFINKRNEERFAVSDPEAELVEEHFRHPTESNPGEFVTSSRAAEIVSTFSQHIKPAAIGRALSRLGFESGREGNSRGYYLVIVDSDERKRRAKSLAVDAMIKRRKVQTPAKQPEEPDTPDVF